MAGNPQQGQENRNPLPNPWSPNSNDVTSSTDRNEENQSRGGGSSAAGGLFGNPSIQNLMQQMMQNPQLMQNMLSAPYTQSMMQAMAANPDMAANVIGANPLFSSNPELQVKLCQVRVSVLNCTSPFCRL